MKGVVVSFLEASAQAGAGMSLSKNPLALYEVTFGPLPHLARSASRSAGASTRGLAIG